ncbi:uncharacterized protein LOC141854351 isoform X2 [Brevipalpus obovatus]|uniref:uncharacterized protein LOC141854351 isoform X2 n=1 Tax=Brevipalpus obovatus TaxID=246614 RepID=UPI003D9F2911
MTKDATARTDYPTRWYLVRALIVIALTLPDVTKADNYYDFLENPIQGCAILGYPNATLNECGYCVGVGTGLDSNYGKDCSGVCGGSAILDCRNQCDGLAYRDECTQECIDDQSSENEQVRDCRGECIRSETSPSQSAFRLDECGYCRLQSSEPSPYIDCAKQCYRPGLVRSHMICGQCLRSNRTAKSSNDGADCGTDCMKNDSNCPCEIDPSSCGCENTNQCYRIQSVEPKAVEKGVETQVVLIGFFYPPQNDFICVIQHQKQPEVTSTSAAIFIAKNRTAIYCLVEPMIEGSYSLSLQSQSDSELYQGGKVSFFAYDPLRTQITSMTPLETLTSDFKNDLELTFSGPNLEEMPIKLVCSVSYDDKNNEIDDENDDDKYQQTLSITGTKPYTCILPAKISHKSSTLLITPTIDGHRPISSHSFTFTLISPPPEVSHQNCFISSDGLTIVIMFTRPVDVNSKQMSSPGPSLCAFVFDEKTLSKLNKYSRITCVWSSKVQLVTYLQKQIQEDSLEISLRRGVFRQDSASIALVNDQPIKVVIRKLTTEWWPYTPKLVITGPSEIPRCGLFSLSAHYSSPKGSTGIKFRWSISKVSGQVSEESELAALISLAETQNILLDTALFEIGVSYEFILKTESEIGDHQSLTATHRIVRFNYDAPIVSIYSNIMLPAIPYTVDNSAVLWAETYIPTCVYPFQRVGLFWKVIDPQVKFNFTLTHFPVYILSPYSLPDNHPVTFYLNAFLGHRINETSGAAFSMIGQPAPLKSIIGNGSPMISLGSESGPIVISGEESGDGSGRPLTYRWSCIDSDSHEPCYFNFSPNKGRFIPVDRNLLLINRTLQRSPNLMLDSRDFLPDRELVISLQVYDRNNTNRVSDVEVALVKVTTGNAPQVIMGSIYIRGKYRASMRSLHNLATVVPAHTPLIVKAVAKPANRIEILEWQSENFIHPLNWRNKVDRHNQIHTELHVHSDHIYPYGFHAFKLKACDRKGACSEATTQFTASQGVTQCQLNIPPYYEYELMTALVERCNIPPGYGPLVYQVYGVSSSTSEVFPLTVPQFSTVFIFPGIPSLDHGSNENTFALKFCDSFSYCEMVLSNPVQVIENSNKSAMIRDLLKLAKKYDVGGEPFAALSVLGTLTRERSLERSILKQAVKDAIDYSLGILQRPSQLLTKGQISLSFHVLSELFRKSGEPFENEKLLDLLHRLCEKSFGLNVLPDLMTLRSTAYNIIAPLSRYDRTSTDNFVESKVLQSARKAFRILLQMAAAQIPLGRRVEFGSFNEDNEDEKHDFVFKTLLIHDKTIRGAVISIDDIEVRVRIGRSVARRYGAPWKCSNDTNQSLLCSSVVYAYTIFPFAAPFANRSESHRLTPVISVDVFAPHTGKLQKFRGDLNAMEMTFTYTGNQTYGEPTYSTKCYSWNEGVQDWKNLGIHLLRSSSSHITCWSGHLSTFTVYRVPGPYNVGKILSITFGVLLFAILLGFATIICTQRDEIQPQTPSFSSQSLIIESTRNSPSGRSSHLLM